MHAHDQLRTAVLESLHRTGGCSTACLTSRNIIACEDDDDDDDDDDVSIQQPHSVHYPAADSLYPDTHLVNTPAGWIVQSTQAQSLFKR
jgi:hypothetical protein